MKTLIISIFFLLTSSISFAETAKQKKTQKQIISLMKQKTKPKIDPKVEAALKRRFANFDGNYVFPSFAHNVFWLNHLNKNFNICPRYTTEIFNGVRTIIIPGGVREVTRTIKVPIYGMVPIYETVPIYEYHDIFETRPTRDLIGYTDPIYGPGPNIIGYEKVPYTDYEPGPWNNWAANPNVADLNGNKTMEGWAIDRHADYLGTLSENAGKNTSELKDIARGNLEDANWCKNGCKIQIIPKEGDINFTKSCTGSNTVECGGTGFFITGSTPEPGKGTPGSEGEWKPDITVEESYRNRDLLPVEKTKDGDPIYETVLIEDKKPIYKEGTEEVKIGEEEVKVGEEEKKVGEKEEKVGEEEKKVTEEEEYGPTEEEEEYQEERRIRAKKEWKFSFAPAYFFDYDFGKLTLNQSEGGFRSISSVKAELGLPTKKMMSRMIASEGGQQAQGQQSYQGAIQRLNYTPANVVPNEDGPYLVKKFYTITAGLGGTVSANYTNAGLLSQLGLSVALIPSIGGGAYSIMFFDNLKEAEKAKHLNIPRSAEDISHWRIGDSLQYDVHGGIVFTGGAGFYGLAAGVSFLAQGVWQRTFSRLDEKFVVAKLEKNKIFSFGVYGAAGLAALSLDKFISKENGLTFGFDISSKRGRTLLEAFMRGDMRKVQAAAADRRDPTVLSDKAMGRTKGKSVSFGFGIPYLPASARWNKGDFLNETNIEYVGSDRKRNTTLYAQVFTFKGKFFPLFKNTTDGYFSTVTLNSGVTPAFARVIKTGQYAFNFQRSNADKKDLEEVLENLLKRTGLAGLLKVKISDNVDKVGSAEIKFAVKFKTAATEFLMDQMKKNQVVFDHIANGFIESYVKGLDRKKADVFGLCEKGMFKHCRANVSKETAKAMFKIKSALQTMSKLDSNTKESREKLARAYTSFGNAMMTNPITFQTILSMAQGKGADVYLSVETSKTRKYEGIIKWSE